jgi:isopenicillin N synthase-like dioxygenase
MANVVERRYVHDGIDHGAHSRLARESTGPAAGLAEIEVVDIAAPDESVAGRLVASFRRTGFAVITGHGVDQELLDAMVEVSHEFFDLPLDEKLLVGFPSREIIRGYEPVPGELDREVNLMESFLINRLDPIADQDLGSLEHRLWRWPNLWPERPAALRPVFERYYKAMEELGDHLLRVLAGGLGLAPDTFTTAFGHHFCNLAANYYPPLTSDRPGRLRNRPHTDHGALTLLYRPSEPGGLEVFAERRWWTVPYVSGSLVLNVGDILDRWTNGILPATPHRVITPAGERAHLGRSSYAFFQQPDPDCVVSPIPGLLGTTTEVRYPDVVCGPHISIKEFGSSMYDSFREGVHQLIEERK